MFRFFAAFIGLPAKALLMYNETAMDENKPVSRRRLFREGASFFGRVVGEFVEAKRGVEEEPPAEESLLEPKRGPLRPPGAVKEFFFNSFCDRCDECIRACPEKVLFLAPPEAGLAQGTPVFDPKRKPCFLCAELHCIKSCPTRALVMVDRVEDLAMGVARLDANRCRAYHGETCSYCIDLCPLKGRAIISLGGRPLIRAPECVGCGLCEYHCHHDAGRGAIVTLAPPLDG